MRVIVCGSMTAVDEMRDIEARLVEMGHTVVAPRLIHGESPENHAESAEHKIKNDLIRGYFDEILKGDALLVVNVERKGVPGYIGGNVLLEMGFAHVLRKPIYLWNSLP